MQKETQKSMYNTIQGKKRVFSFLDDFLKEPRGSINSHNEIVDEVLSRLDTE